MPRPRTSSAPKPTFEQLSDRQRRILEVIRDAVMLRGYPPSIREIGDTAGLQSTSSVAYQLKQLEEKGFLQRDPNKPRAMIVRNMPETKKPGRRTNNAERNVNSGSPVLLLPQKRISTRITPCRKKSSVAEISSCCKSLVSP